jgi:hypothetical protein
VLPHRLGPCLAARLDHPQRLHTQPRANQQHHNNPHLVCPTQMAANVCDNAATTGLDRTRQGDEQAARAGRDIGQCACPRLICVGRGAITSYLSRITSMFRASPSTVIVCPLRMRRVATPVPMTAGMPHSRATTVLWLSGTTCQPRCCRSDMRAGLRQPRSHRTIWPACLSSASAAASWQALQGSGKHNRTGRSDRHLHVSRNVLECGSYASAAFCPVVHQAQPAAGDG